MNLSRPVRFQRGEGGVMLAEFRSERCPHLADVLIQGARRLEQGRGKGGGVPERRTETTHLGIWGRLDLKRSSQVANQADTIDQILVPFCFPDDF